LRPRSFPDGAPLVALAVLGLALLGADCARTPERPDEFPPAPAPPPSVRGTLRISGFGPGPAAPDGASLLHHSVYVNGWRYSGQEDNDLRGYLDGRFRYGWNQPTQYHVRAGRWKHSQRWGEYELFRVLYRWGDLGLPRDTVVRSARIRIFVEKPSFNEEPVTVMLYEEKKPYNAGEGGRLRNNISPPKQGEVWWGQLAHDEKPWGHPGAGFASDVHPDADTGAQALAETVLAPGDTELVFESAALARYVERAAARSRPVYLLLKLSDRDEDVRGTAVHLWSGNVGVHHNPVRRPRLELDWSSPTPQAVAEHAVHLEHGRTAELPALKAPGTRRYIVSFQPEEGSEWPRIQVRSGPDEEWRIATVGPLAGRDGLSVRLSATRSAVARGQAFEGAFRDTWVTSAPPEEQQVTFTFVAPSGDVHRTQAQYQGDYTWKVSFPPDELGRWRYWYEHELDEGFRGAEGVFDCVPGDRAAIAQQLRDLAQRIRDRHYEDPELAVHRFGPEFWALERAALASLTPEEWAGAPGRELDALIVDVRNLMDVKEVPATQRLRPAKLDWQEEQVEAKP
jgi:hypothetical protein